MEKIWRLILRVFYAIEFEDEIKEYIYKQQIKVKEKSVKGNFSRKENIHLTLKFIGEVQESKVKELARVLEKSTKDRNSFYLILNRTGQFKKGSRSIVWVGIEQSKALETLHETLEDQLHYLGYEKETRSFKPHVTIGRQVILKEDISDILLNKKVKVKKISLMESKRVEGVLTYIPIASVYLK